MILRAMFFIAALTLLAPHGTGSAQAGSAAIACGGGTCTADASMIARLKADVLARLVQVKAEIAAAQAARAAGG